MKLLLARKISGVEQYALALRLHVLKLATVDGPPQTTQNEKYQHYRQRNEQVKDVHGKPVKVNSQQRAREV
jgi:hypothetical protein